MTTDLNRQQEDNNAVSISGNVSGDDSAGSEGTHDMDAMSEENGEQSVYSAESDIIPDTTRDMNSDVNSNNNIHCIECSNVIANEKLDVFCVPGAEGTIGAYVNPHGYDYCKLILLLYLRLFIHLI
jgi:nitrate reductase cytochrome c-type subunit